VADVPFLPAARQEVLSVTDHYEAVSPGLGEEFIAELERAVARIAAFPDHGSPYFAGTRRVVLNRFPFDVVYRSEGDILVIAVAHHRRKPFYWRTRL
jgi:toxin ParE1/3/4